LAARLTGWDIDILTPVEYNKGLDDMVKALRSIEGVDDMLLEKFMTMGLISVGDIEEIGPEPLIKELEVSEELANHIVAESAEAAKRLAAEAQAAKEAAAAAAAEEAARAALEAQSAPAEGEAAVADGEPMEAGANVGEATAEETSAAVFESPTELVAPTTEAEKSEG